MAPVTRTSGLVPAAATRQRPPTGQEADLPGHDDALRSFIESVGGRETFTEVLSVASPDPAVQKILRLLLNPKHDGTPLSQLCRLAGLTVADFFVAYRKGTLAKAQIIATLLIADKVCAVVEDVMTRAAPHQVVCERCRGVGSLPPRPTISYPNPAPKPCAKCGASGRVDVLPNLDRQKLALELAQLTTKSGGLFIQQNTGVSTTATATAEAARAAAPQPVVGALEQLQQAVSQILYSSGPMTTLDVEPIRPRAEPPAPIAETIALDGETIDADPETIAEAEPVTKAD